VHVLEEYTAHVLHYVALRCSVLQCVAVSRVCTCFGGIHCACVAVHCCVLQCVAVRCSA